MKFEVIWIPINEQKRARGAALSIISRSPLPRYISAYITAGDNGFGWTG